ncbi:MAG: MFS transporter [Spirochaetes bacterium]|nr:MFS transporter [Spirochaetota bacterium]
MKDQSIRGEALSLRTKLGFGAGDIFGGGSLVIIGFFYLYFLTDVLLISPVLAGTVFLVSKVWDAVTDPFMGIISDRTRTRFGRRRPYFLAGVVLVFLSFTMMWFPVDFTQEMHRFAFVLAAYVFFATSYTIVMIPYFSLASELTTDYNERTSLTTFRMIFSMVSSLTCALIPMEIVKSFQGQRAGYLVMALVFGLVFSLPFLATFFATRERPEFQKEMAPFDLKRSFIEPFRTPTFVNALFMYLFALTAMDILMSIIMYYMTYYIGRASETNYVLGAMLVTQVLSIPLFALISRRIGKKKSYMIACVEWLAVIVMSLLLGPRNPHFAIYLFGVLVGVGSGGIYVMVYSIMPDVPDVDELYSGMRREGMFSGIMTFMRKFGSAVGIFIVSYLLAFTGYRKPVEETVEGVTRLVQQQQSDAFILSLRLILVVVPAVFILAGLFNALRYRLTPEIHDRLNVFLTARRKGLAYSAGEEEELKRLMIRRRG